MNTREIICILCPVGCRMQATENNDAVESVSGNECRRGLAYAEQEVLSPARVITTTMQTGNREYPLLPVRSSDAVPKEKIYECLDEIAQRKIESPVAIGDTVIADIQGTGIDIVACSSLG